MTTTARRMPGLLVREVDGEILVLDPAAERIHRLNATASLIWRSLDEKFAPEHIAQRIAERYDVSEPDALRDVRELMSKLRALGLLA